MMRIIESKYITSAINQSGFPDTIWKDFAFVGRSNVGKSSMINTLTNRKLLAKIANKPGKTRLINFFEIKYLAHVQGCFGLVDLPGYGYARVSKSEKEKWQKMINLFFQKRQQLAGVIVLIDIRHELDPKDIVMINMLKDLKICFMIAATKCDKIPKNKIHGQLKKFLNELEKKDVQSEIASDKASNDSLSSLNEPSIDKIYISEFSSLKKIGINKILQWIEMIICSETTRGKVIIHDKECLDA